METKNVNMRACTRVGALSLYTYFRDTGTRHGTRLRLTREVRGYLREIMK